VRFKYDKKPERANDPKKPVKHFWAMVAWNYKENAIQILQITQSSLRKRLADLNSDADWGVPYKYDIKIYKTGEKMDTEYSLNPCPSKELDRSIMDEFYQKPIRLEHLFTNEDPFSPSAHILPTKGFFETSLEAQGSIKVSQVSQNTFGSSLVDISPVSDVLTVRDLTLHIEVRLGQFKDVERMEDYLHELSIKSKGAVKVSKIIEQAMSNDSLLERFYSGFVTWKSSKLEEAIPF